MMSCVKKIMAGVGACVTLLVAGCAPEPSIVDDVDRYPSDVKQQKIEIVRDYPFDQSSFTQGLEFDHEGNLLVSTGLKGKSRVYRIRDWENTSKPSVSMPLHENIFGEGIAVFGDTLWQLTWRDHFAVRRDAETLEYQGLNIMEQEGWGACSTFDNVVTSDGSSSLYFRDPEDFRIDRVVDVTFGGQPLVNLNELDCSLDEAGEKWFVYANVWHSDRIVKIDASTGRVVAVVDASEAVAEAKAMYKDIDVLNGVAKIPGRDSFVITGKFWPVMFEVKFINA